MPISIQKDLSGPLSREAMSVMGIRLVFSVFSWKTVSDHSFRFHWGIKLGIAKFEMKILTNLAIIVEDGVCQPSFWAHFPIIPCKQMRSFFQSLGLRVQIRY